jgi:hypothetical protein
MLCHTRSSISKFLIDRQASCGLASADRELCGLAPIAAMSHAYHVRCANPLAGHLRQVDQREMRGIGSEVVGKFNSLLAYRADRPVSVTALMGFAPI